MSTSAGSNAALIPLKGWIDLCVCYEREGIRGVFPAGYGEKELRVDALKREGIYASKEVSNQARTVATINSVRVARLIVDCLVSGDSGQYNIEPTQRLKINEISTESFLVEIQVPSEVPITDPLSANGDELLQKCNLTHIKFILEGALEVKLVPALQNKIGFQVDERQHDFFQKLGDLFYELFTRDGSSPPNLQSENVDAAHQIARVSVRTKDRKDEEHPGSEKGRRKYTEFDTSKAMKRLDLSGTMESLQQKSLPMSICRLVTDLVEYGIRKEEMFLSLRDVVSELMQIINEPKVFVLEENIGQMMLDFNENNLYGRNDALSILIQTVLTAPLLSESGISSVVLIGGDPGAGKSSLVHSIEKPIIQRGWQLFSCKFDRLTQNQPLSTISSVFDDFFRSIAKIRSELEDGVLVDEDQDHYIRSVTASVESHLSASGIVFLSKLIPSIKSLFPDIFRRVVVDDDDSEDAQVGRRQSKTKFAASTSITRNGVDIIGDDDSDNDGDDDGCLISQSIKNRLHYLFKKLAQAISSPRAPIMIYLDDLQWADDESLDLLASLVVDVDPLTIEEDADQRCICFVITYRKFEGISNQNFVDFIEALKVSDSTQLTSIQLEGMDIEATNDMVANALKLPVRLTRSLADVVQLKTRGNPLFVKVFLAVLFEENSLRYSLKERRWSWDINEIHQKSMNKDLALILSEKLLRMTHEIQDALTFVSCFGMKVRRDVLLMASCNSEEFSRILDCLETSVKEGVLEKDDECFAFPHDLIQQAAYERLPRESILAYHFNIGLRIIKKVTRIAQAEPPSSASFIALEQINIAKDMTVPEPKIRMSLAALFLQAGKDFIDVAAFPSALSYFERGLSLLGDGGWELNHDTSLRLHESICHACYLNALPDRVPIYMDKIISNTDDFMDQIRGHHIYMQTLATTGDFKRAMDKFFEVMKELDEELPLIVEPSLILSSLNETRDTLIEYSLEALLSLPKMTDKRKQWAMTFMDTMTPYFFMISPSHVPILAARMVTISVNYGLTNQFAYGLSSFSSSILRSLQDIDDAYHWSKLSSAVLEKVSTKSMCPKIKLVQYSFLHFFKEPLQSVRSVLSRCRQDAMMFGDIEYSIFSAQFHCQFVILSGDPLSNAEEECAVLSKDMIRLKQVQAVLGHLCIHNMVLQLTGSTKDSFGHDGITFRDEDEVLNHVESAGNLVVANSIYAYRVIAACFFRRFKYAAAMIEKYNSQLGMDSLHFTTIIYVFYEGLVAFKMARSQSENNKWSIIGERSLIKYKEWAKHSEWNFENKLLLLEAESLFLQGDYESAEKKYIASIESARRHKFIHEQGLATDMLASFHNFRGNAEKEGECLQGVFACYETWGAYGVLSTIIGENCP